METEEGRSCARCGADEDEWSEPLGYQRDGEVYCCQGCAGGTGCECSPAHKAEEERGDYAGL